jgi:hypothetical protein
MVGDGRGFAAEGAADARNDRVPRSGRLFADARGPRGRRRPASPVTVTPTPTPVAPDQPPHLQIVPTKPRPGRPDVYVELSAFRIELISETTHKVMGYRYYFAAQGMRCINGATDLVFTVANSRRVERCTQSLVVFSPQLSPHKRYSIDLQAVKMRRKRIVKRGASYTGSMYMPGNEVHWQPVSAVPPGT